MSRRSPHRVAPDLPMAARRARAVALVAILCLAPIVAKAETATCVERALVLSAFPAELDPLLAAADAIERVEDDGHIFYVGRLEGNDVVLALTGIGRVNARRATERALARFSCDGETAIGAIVFSGVAGGRSSIGDVAIPERWTADGGATWHAVDAEMLATARAVAPSVALSRTATAGDPACAGTDPALVPVVDLVVEPSVVIGGDGVTTDPFGGRAFPCWPGGGDVFGCRPCRHPDVTVDDATRAANRTVPFVDPAFFFGFFASPPPPATEHAAEDMESGAVAAVAAARGLPFIAFRGVSDGRDDPLMLPGFPFQFFAYRQIAAENASRVTRAFLAARAGMEPARPAERWI